MPNCFPPPPAPTPEEGGVAGGSVSEEYAEYTMDEIINGRVSAALSLLSLPPPKKTFFGLSEC